MSLHAGDIKPFCAMQLEVPNLFYSDEIAALQFRALMTKLETDLHVHHMNIDVRKAFYLEEKREEGDERFHYEVKMYYMRSPTSVEEIAIAYRREDDGFIVGQLFDYQHARCHRLPICDDYNFTYIVRNSLSKEAAIMAAKRKLMEPGTELYLTTLMERGAHVRKVTFASVIIDHTHAVMCQVFFRGTE